MGIDPNIYLIVKEISSQYAITWQISNEMEESLCYYLSQAYLAGAKSTQKKDFPEEDLDDLLQKVVKLIKEEILGR